MHGVRRKFCRQRLFYNKGEHNMKEQYTAVELETFFFTSGDVITASENPDAENGTPFEPVNGD